MRAVIEAATCERDRLLLRVLWATGARVSEALALRPMHVQRDHLVLPNRKNPSLPVKRVYLPAGQADLPGALLVWANEQGLPPNAPPFFSRKRSADGGLKAISRVQAWSLVKTASERANVRVLALRASHQGAVGEPAPVHPHLFRHARVRQIVRTTRNLPLAQRQAGWSRLQMAYLTLSDAEARERMRSVQAWAGRAMDRARRIGVLRSIAERLAGTDLVWTLTGSTRFWLQGVPVEPHAIDVQTDAAGAYLIPQRLWEFVVSPVRLSMAAMIRSHLGTFAIDGTCGRGDGRDPEAAA